MKRIVVLVTLLGCAAPGFGAPADELLRQVRESAAAAAKVNAAREQRFLRNRNEQAQLLKQAEAELASVEARAERIKQQFDARQREITALKNQIQGQSGQLAQLFAIARQGAADFHAMAVDSYVTAQLPDRLQGVRALAQSPAVPGIPELEDLWITLQEELTENGKVARFEAEVIGEGGAKQRRSVVRVGVFTAFSPDTYLTMAPGLGQLVALTPQPGRRYRQLAGSFSAADAGTAPALIDPSRGALLAIEAEKPSLGERVAQGGVVGYVILTIGAVGLGIALFQLVYLSRIQGRVGQQLRMVDQPQADNPLGRVLAAYQNAQAADDPELLELHLSEAVLKETPHLERFQSILRLFAAMAPLLGLLGTVTGMIVTFQAITAFGTGDPKLMAGGISQALVTTVLGLIVAIPILFLNTLLSSRARALVQILDEQTAGLIARRLEARRVA